MNYTAQIGKIDAANQTKIGDEFEIKSHPSFIWFQNQKPNVYSGGLLAEDIYTWIKRKMDPPSELVDEQRLEAFQKEEKILVVFYGDPESKEFEQYKRATFADIKGKYVHVTDKKMKLPQGLKMPGIAVFRNFDDPVRVFIGPITTEAIEEFVKELSVPRCVELILEYFEEIFEPGKPSLFLFYDEKNPDQNKTKELFCKSAEKKKAKVKYVFSGITEGVQMNLAEYIGINKKVLPKLAILENVQDKGMDKYLYEGDVSKLSVDAIDNFVAKFKDGKLLRNYKSEEIPEINDAPVKTIVGRNFRDFVGKEKEVFLMFFVPWCNECYELEEGLHIMAKDLQDKAPNLLFAKCNAALNEIEGVTISGYPSFKFFKSGNSTGVEYEGHIQITDFYKYLLTHSESYKEYVDKNSESKKKEDL